MTLDDYGSEAWVWKRERFAIVACGDWLAVLRWITPTATLQSWGKLTARPRTTPRRRRSP